jgi:hypothetical protein
MYEESYLSIFLNTTHTRSLHSLSLNNKETFMVTAEAVNKLEKKARSEKKADNAISGQVDGNFFLYPYMRNAALTSLLLLNLSRMFIFCYQPHL